MDFLGWNILLLALKWVFIGLIYFALLTVLLAVRREMRLRFRVERPRASVAPGRLVVMNPGSDLRTSPGTVFDLKPETSLGTAQENDIILGDQFISRQHARLIWDGVDWWIEDLGSRNGTYLNEARCEPLKPQLFPVGSSLRTGDMVFKLQE